MHGKFCVFLVNVVNCSIYKRYENWCIKLDHVLYSINYGIMELQNVVMSVKFSYYTCIPLFREDGTIIFSIFYF